MLIDNRMLQPKETPWLPKLDNCDYGDFHRDME